MPVETEIKFPVTDLADLARRLPAAGFHLETPRAFESNVLYDTRDRQMRARTEILRIRNYANRCTITHKRLVPDRPQGAAQEGEASGRDRSADRHKHRIETETEVSNGDAMAEIFNSLGLEPAFRYEKWRTEWADGDGHCVVDETPIGNYAELEGTPQWIDRIAATLGVDHSRYITLSYGRLFDLWREQHPDCDEHLTFDAVARCVAKG
jgi:adenylate cyclase class 2